MIPRIWVRKVRRFAMRSVLVPTLAASAWLGVTSGGHARASMTPAPSKIAYELAARHDLPKGTSISVGDPKKPTTLAYDDRGRILLTPPKGETFGAVLWRGFGRLETLASHLGDRTASMPLTTADRSGVAQ